MNRICRVRAPRRTRTVIAGVVLTGALLSGCSATLLGSAAVVQGERIPISEIQASLTAAQELRRSYGGVAQANPQAANREVHRRVINAIFEEAARGLGVVASEGELAVRTSAAVQAAGSEDAFLQVWALENNISAEQVKEMMRRELLLEKMMAKISADAGGSRSQTDVQALLTNHLVSTARGMAIRINPRYGTFDPELGQIRPFAPDYYSPPSDEPVDR